MNRIGFDDPLSVELPETKRSTIAREFSEVGAATAAFGHGLTITPLHMAAAMAAFVNGGILVPPTLFPRTSGEAMTIGRRVISPQTGTYVRYLMRLNALEGSGRHMNKIAEGYLAGGKTGTADKVVNGRYDSSRNLAVFASGFPLNDPKYVMVILVDEPKRENAHSGRTAAWNAGEVTGRIIHRIAPVLGVMPDFSELTEKNLVPPEIQSVKD